MKQNSVKNPNQRAAYSEVTSQMENHLAWAVLKSQGGTISLTVLYSQGETISLTV